MPVESSYSKDQGVLRLPRQDELRDHFGRDGFFLEHDLTSHPLFTLDRLASLAQDLPSEKVEFNSGVLPLEQNPLTTPKTGLSLAETIRTIDSCNSWVVLKQVEHDPEYRELLRDCLSEIERQLLPPQIPFFKHMGFVFLSSPGAVTPFHIDPENNFLLQIRGCKEMSLFSASDREVLPHETLERFYSRGHRNLKLPDDALRRARNFELVPGSGLHVPQNAPHYVKNGAEVSISFSITFQTPASDRHQGQYWFNRKLRELGFSPAPPSDHGLRAESKYRAYQMLRSVKRAFTDNRA